VRVQLGSRSVGKSADVTDVSERVDPSGEAKCGGGSPRKSSKLMDILPVPQSDTGRRIKDTIRFRKNKETYEVSKKYRYNIEDSNQLTQELWGARFEKGSCH